MLIKVIQFITVEIYLRTQYGKVVEKDFYSFNLITITYLNSHTK